MEKVEKKPIVSSMSGHADLFCLIGEEKALKHSVLLVSIPRGLR